MREKKYANVVQEYEKALEEERQKKEAEAKEKEATLKTKKSADLEEKKEAELSMTRELKFEEVRKQIEEDTALEEKIEELNSKKSEKLEKEIAELEAVEIPIEKKKTTRKNKKETANSKAKVTETIEQLKKLDDTVGESEVLIKNVETEDSDDIQIKELLDSVKKKKSKKKLNENTLETKEEDIYLTTSFQPLKKKSALKKIIKVVVVLLVVILGIGALGYFVALPIYNKYVNSKPKMIFDKTLDSFGTKSVDILKKLMNDNDDNYFIDFNFRINTNDSKLYVLSNYNFGYKFGINPDNDSLETLIYLKDGQQLYGVNSIRNNDKYYAKMTTGEKYIDVTSEIDEEQKNSIINGLSEFYEVSNNLSEDDMEYYINKHIEIFKILLEKSLITASDDEIEVDGNKIKVVKNSFKIDRNDYERLTKKYVEFVNNDSRLLKIDNILNDIDENQKLNVDEYLDGLNDDYSFIFNIYTVNGTDVVGIDAEEDGFRLFYYYSTEEAFDLFLDLTEDEDCLTGTDCDLSKQNIIDVSGKKDNNIYNVEVKYNGQKIADLVVRSFTIDKIDLDYEVTYEEETYKGNLLLLPDYDDYSFNLDFSFKNKGDYVNVNLFVDLHQNGDIGFVDKEKVVKYSESVYKKELEQLYKSMDEQGLVEGFDMWYLIITSPDLIGDEETPKEENNGSAMATA